MKSQAHLLKQIKQHFVNHPEGTVSIGFTRMLMTKDEWYRDFLETIHYRINERAENPDFYLGNEKRYQDYFADRNIINEHKFTRIRRSGMNLLRTPKLRKRYPEINTRNLDD